jgi:hypothetical protein
VVWAGTSGGRIFITTNGGAANPATIVWRRIDHTSAVDPPRYPSDIYVDPSDPFHAYITYSGYNAVTPTTPGHVFEVKFDPATGNATFTNLDGAAPHALGDVPVGTIERDEAKGGVLYIGTDFGVAQRGAPADRVDFRSAGTAHDDHSVPEDRPGARRHVRHDARVRRLVAEAAVGQTRTAESRGRLRAAPRLSKAIVSAVSSDRCRRDEERCAASRGCPCHPWRR